LGHNDELDELEWAQAAARKNGGVASSFASSAARPAVTPDFMPRRGLGLDFDADSDAPPHAHVRCAHTCLLDGQDRRALRAHTVGVLDADGGLRT
jgi:hypothetical protein